jgi:hypothetical protein
VIPHISIHFCMNTTFEPSERFFSRNLGLCITYWIIVLVLAGVYKGRRYLDAVLSHNSRLSIIQSILLQIFGNEILELPAIIG